MHFDRRKTLQRAITICALVPISRLAEGVTAINEDFKEERMLCLICAHISGDHFHTFIPFNGSEDFRRGRAHESRMVTRAVDVRCVAHGHDKAHVQVQESAKWVLGLSNVMNHGCF
ncbi:hypothetical protein ABL78_2120 [Leptomonas seymouri]|uniref:Uncharacterized protein n=1 Tax=Leptomonas seymouri TaxID=5684 RepID=A0A0N1PDL1_LEPSE|nr:hypothetical protein ABL78_2120 [Leptomonas seymouri]|eukprot:KPI88741.1 hypothetical protein ABL78_2120 [Leptomonas seymouri]